MKFKPLIYGTDNLGHYFEGENFVFIFGNRFLTFDHLEKEYSNLNFKSIKQVHGDGIVKSHSHSKENTKANEISKKSNKIKSRIQPFLLEADAHWTDELQSFLCIFTADCLPILFSDTKKVVALHAGWRGLAQEIISKLVKKCFSSSISFLKVAIGPHIQEKSYEVKNDVREAMARCYRKYIPHVKTPKPLFFPHQDPDKRYVSLKALAYAELLYSGLSSDQIYIFNEDSFTSPHYFSYRRDGKKAGRQISGVFKKKV